MNAKSLFSVGLFLVLAVALATVAYAVPLTVESVEVNGDPVFTADTNRLDLIRGDTIDVKVRMLGNANGTNVEVRAFMSGFEFNRDRAISDVSPLFDVEQGVTYVKTLHLRLPDIAERDDYMLRVLVSDRYSGSIQQDFRIKLDVPRHSVVIKDMILNPDTDVMAGRALIATVRVKNTGQRTQEGIKVKVSIPDLGISATDYIDSLDFDESSTSEELYLRIPVCAKEGAYDVRGTVSFDEGTEEASITKRIIVDSSDACVQNVKDKTLIIVGSEPQNVVAGQGGVVFPVTISNMGSTPKVYNVVVEGVDSWGTVKVSPSTVIALNPNEAKTATLFVTAKPEASAGEHSFTVSIKDQAGNTLQQVMMRANVQSSQAVAAPEAGVRKYLEIGLIVLVVLLIIVALIVAFSRMREKEEEEEPKTYY